MSFWLFLLTLATIYVLASLSLVVLTGWSGQLNLHVAAFGLGWGAYAAFALVSFGVPALLAIVLAGVACAPFAVLVAAASARFRGLEVAVATLAVGLIFERLFFRTIARTLSARGAAGPTPFESSFVPMPRPSIGPLHLDGDLSFFVFALAITAAIILVVRNLSRGATGRTLRALRERELMAETLGVPVVAYRIGAVVASTAIAATGGALLASLKSGIAPDSFNLDLSFQLLAATVIGGVRSIRGAVIGGTLAALLPELVRVGPLQVFAGERLFLLFGIGMVVALWRLPDGLASLRLGRPREAGTWAAAAVGLDADLGASIADAPLAAGATGSGISRLSPRAARRRLTRPTVLRTDGVRMRFGGVVALDGVDVSVRAGEVCALIGPNGAGKSTLFNCITGALEPDEGRVYALGRDITELSPSKRAALGIGRTFQTIEAFRDATVLENVMIAGHRLRSASAFAEALGLSSARRSERALESRGREVLDLIGLASVATSRTSDLPLGHLRVLELGMALVAHPTLLLLDEPSAGLDPQETDALATLLARLRVDLDLAVLLVEHDMTLVGALADHVYVLDAGRIIAQGTPEQIRNDAAVLETYLGSSETADELVASGRSADARA